MTEAPPAPPGSDITVPARAPRVLGTLLRLDRAVQRVEVALCAASLLLMIGLAFAQVLLRTFRGEVLQPVAWFGSAVMYCCIDWYVPTRNMTVVGEPVALKNFSSPPVTGFMSASTREVWVA